MEVAEHLASQIASNAFDESVALYDPDAAASPASPQSLRGFFEEDAARADRAPRRHPDDWSRPRLQCRDSRGEGAGGGEDLEGCKMSKDCGNAAFSKRFRFLTMRIHMTTHPTTVLYKHA